MRPPSTPAASRASAWLAAGLPSSSAGTKSALPPASLIWLTTARPRSPSRPATATWAPAAPIAMAISRPILLVAPVTRAALSCSRCVMPARLGIVFWTRKSRIYLPLR